MQFMSLTRTRLLNKSALFGVPAIASVTKWKAAGRDGFDDDSVDGQSYTD